MTPELLFFILRLALALALYAFLGAIAYLLWRDVRAAATSAAARQRRFGQLTALPPVTIAGSPANGRGGSGKVEVEARAGTYPLLPITSLGRAPTNTVALADDTASLEHALVTLRGGQWWLEDLGSRNGTTVNGTKIDQPVVVSAGDVIGIGRARLMLELD